MGVARTATCFLGRDAGERVFLAARVLARNSGTSQNSPASVRSQFLEAAAARGEGPGRAEEVDLKALPVPVSVRGAAAAAAAGAEMPKGGEGWARVVLVASLVAAMGRLPPSPQSAGLGPQRDPRRRRPSPSPLSHAWASTLNCPDWEAEDHSSRGLLRWGV